jgi:hypothetical protein
MKDTSITGEQLERLGQLADTANNLHGALQLPMPPQFHVEQMKGQLLDLRNDLRDLVREVGGEDPWEGQP